MDAKEPPRILRLEVPTSGIDALSWLEAQQQPVKFYWTDREKDFEVAAVGLADVMICEGAIDYDALFDRLHQRLSSADGEARYYGGMRFNDHLPADGTWRRFGSCRFFLPRFELCTRSGQSTLACHLMISKKNSISPSAILAESDAMASPATGEEKSTANLIKRLDTPDRAAWGRNLEAAIRSLARGTLQKIVLARKSLLEFDAQLNPFALLRSLKSATTDCFHFCFIPSRDVAFIGASPERLYARQGRSVQTEALAGTRPRGCSREADEKLAQELLQSQKDGREHRLVVDGIREALAPLCQTLEADDKVRLLRLARSQHLLSIVRGMLSDGVSDAQLLSRLHPTPAVGGYPTAAALREIESLESFDRGWYAGPIGWVGREKAEFAVAIRSGLVEGSRLSLFAGAGIVEGSTAEGEWDEIENKISDFIKVLTDS